MSATPDSTLDDLQQTIADLKRQLAESNAERDEALGREAASAEVLQVINSSPGDLAPVFEAMLERAVRLCEFDLASLWTYDGTSFCPVAKHRVPEPLMEYMQEHTPPAFARLVGGDRLVHIADVQGAINQTDFTRNVRRLGLDTVRSILIIPLRKDTTLLGLIAAYRREVGPFTDKQIALLQNFAAQAVIAMENARLITETREALEQQTATAEVLGVINASPGDLAPVFNAILEKAHRLCGITFGSLQLSENGKFRAVAVRGVADSLAELLREPVQPMPGTPAARLADGEAFVQIEDVAEVAKVHPERRRPNASAAHGLHTVLCVPLRKDTNLLGYITGYRDEVRLFSEKEIALLQNFADQAVIAMENARLITETREALEQQTATAEVLEVINSSPGDLAPVFDAILEKAHALCGVSFGSLLLYDRGQFHAGATRGLPEPLTDLLRQPFPPDPDGPLARLLSGERFYQIGDQAEFLTTSLNPRARATFDLAGVRTVLFVPLRRDEALLGAIVAYRREPRAFSEKQIALLQNFAAQAVIAMENARLISETREALEQQTATAEVLQVINSSPGDLTPVFDAMLEKAHSLCDVSNGSLQLYDGQYFHAVATRGMSQPLMDLLREPYSPDPDGLLSSLIAGARFVQIDDQVAELAAQTIAPSPRMRLAVELDGIRTALFVPLRRNDALLGMISCARQEVRPFTDKQIALLQNFAAQAVIAMENARLLGETREALEQQTATAEVLQVINSSPGDLGPVFDALLEKATRLCEASCGNLYTYDGGMFHTVAVHGDPRLVEWLHQLGSFRPIPSVPIARLLVRRVAPAHRRGGRIEPRP
jgi:GAF domain-containing protein